MFWPKGHDVLGEVRYCARCDKRTAWSNPDDRVLIACLDCGLDTTTELTADQMGRKLAEIRRTTRPGRRQWRFV